MKLNHIPSSQTLIKRPIIWSHGRKASESRRRPRLELLNICSSCKKAETDM